MAKINSGQANEAGEKKGAGFVLSRPNKYFLLACAWQFSVLFCGGIITHRAHRVDEPRGSEKLANDRPSQHSRYASNGQGPCWRSSQGLAVTLRLAASTERPALSQTTPPSETSNSSPQTQPPPRWLNSAKTRTCM
ncbi:predicted protein [Coccidioides posadasii str. Silveira]|uniref:Predicted protein n=1 Tax=Coccidioides posadasii (strain RMSCC 757 / Silveira) TaxID=443226 RepID=E9DHP0_COCPS|nr:predicted protein [Coccidioides posadasii str. Silveira]